MKLNQCPLTDDEKRHMIAEAAYYRSSKTGSGSEDPIGDWLDAEAEVERSLKDLCRKEAPGKRLEAYQHMQLGATVERWWQRLISRTRFRSQG